MNLHIICKLCGHPLEVHMNPHYTAFKEGMPMLCEHIEGCKCPGFEPLLCKKLSTLVCKCCKKNVCYRHIFDPCYITSYPDKNPGIEIPHDLDGVPATCCTVEVEI